MLRAANEVRVSRSAHGLLGKQDEARHEQPRHSSDQQRRAPPITRADLAAEDIR